MNTTIAKEFNWEMSHRLTFHDGPCKNIHGHSYKMRLELKGEVNEYGMLIDFYTLAQIIEPLINKLDHSFLCDSQDWLILDFLKKNNFKYQIIEKFSTVENITEYILAQIAPEFKKYTNLTNLKIRVYETEDAYAESEVNLKEGAKIKFI